MAPPPKRNLRRQQQQERQHQNQHPRKGTTAATFRPALVDYLPPATETVANFVGRMNWIKGQITQPGLFETDLGDEVRLSLPVRTAEGPGTRGYLLVRPEHVVLSPEPAGAATEIEGRVLSRIYLGPTTHFHIRVGDATLVAYVSGSPGLDADSVFVSWSSEEASFMPEAGVAALGP